MTGAEWLTLILAGVAFSGFILVARRQSQTDARSQAVERLATRLLNDVGGLAARVNAGDTATGVRACFCPEERRQQWLRGAEAGTDREVGTADDIEGLH